MISVCDVVGCDRLTVDFKPSETDIFHRCALHEIASYNAEELREWGEQNAADMVEMAREQLAHEEMGAGRLVSVSCDGCGENEAVTQVWGPNLCETCDIATTQGDGGADAV